MLTQNGVLEYTKNVLRVEETVLLSTMGLALKSF